MPFWRRGNTCSLWLQERDGYRILEVQSSEVRSSSCSGSLMAILPYYYVFENYYSDVLRVEFPIQYNARQWISGFFWGVLTIYLYGFYLFPWRTSFNNMYKGN